MEESKKKKILIGVIVVCLVAACVIFWRTRSGAEIGGAASLKRGKLIWVKCNNPDCGAEYQIDRKDYFQQIEEKQQSHAASLVAPPLECKECGKASLYRAVKCEKCGKIFFFESVPNDYGDRCPNCGYSKIEEDRKKAADQRSR